MHDVIAYMVAYSWWSFAHKKDRKKGDTGVPPHHFCDLIHIHDADYPWNIFQK